MVDDKIKKFWIDYYNSDEIEQYKKLETLTLFKLDDKDVFIKHITISSVKSYIDDIIEVFKK